MKDLDSFDHRPDPAIGRLLREHLAPQDDAEFVTRMQAAARRAGLGGRAAWPWRGLARWDVPDRWFRPGIAAAAAILVGALIGVGIVERGSRQVWLAESLRPAEAPAELFAAEQKRPDPQLLLTRLLEAP
jgi:hypothetical protein